MAIDRWDVAPKLEDLPNCLRFGLAIYFVHPIIKFGPSSLSTYYLYHENLSSHDAYVNIHPYKFIDGYIGDDTMELAWE